METSQYGLLRVDRTGHVTTITLNRPGKLNALNRQLTTELHTALDEVSRDRRCRAVVLTGEGRGFCSGADVAAIQKSRVSSSNHEGFGIETLFPHIRSVPQPVIAAVNGVAAGAGLGIALACDIRVASEESNFSCIFVRRSIAPDTGTSYTLPRLVGQGIAMEMALTGNIYGADWALEKGLVNRVVPSDQLMEESQAMANEIASNPPICVSSIKRLFYVHDEDMMEVLSKESTANAPSAGSEDALEAVRSFLEKRPPIYRGR